MVRDEFCLLLLKSLVTTSPFVLELQEEKALDTLLLTNRLMFILALLDLGIYSESFHLPTALRHKRAVRLPLQLSRQNT